MGPIFKFDTLFFVFGLFTFSFATVILRIGVVSNFFNHSQTNLSTSLTLTSSSQQTFTAEIYWKVVNTKEAFQVLESVLDLNQSKVDFIVVKSNRWNFKDNQLVWIPILRWSFNTTSNKSTKESALTSACKMTSTVSPNIDSSCLKPVGQFETYHPIKSNASGAVVSLIAVISHLKWSSVCIIYDKETENEAMKIHNGLSIIGIFAVAHKMEEMTSSKIDALTDMSVPLHESSLNFTVLCRLDSCKQYLLKPFEYGREHVWRSSLRHYSRWLVGLFDDGDISVLEVKNSSVLDNIAIIQFPTSFLEVHAENDLKFEDALKQVLSHMEMNSSMDINALKHNAISTLSSLNDTDNNCTWIPIRALMWHTNSRPLNTVGYVQLNGSVLSKPDIFPNAKFGFNKRKFIVATMPWKPFVEYDNITKNYSGFTIDLLQQIALGLNFSYEFVRPPDNQWGVDVGNNTWTGLVGVLQRREVDLVAAALTAHIDRKVVMDFSHPFFYEFSSILLKRPDPNSTKWRTLIDPFHPLVLLCILVSLPVSALFLFFFEKYNPFYKTVEDRVNLRGLHHYSDSFWYMYGALLTQGGEHMADSSAGRTLLSFWWIFCIIMMATYSGNLIAFLTVTKDRLPFEDLETLAAQDAYKYGTLGGTSYETIFKGSTFPVRREIWRNIVEFNSTDPSVLSSDPDVQIQKVSDGSYAYIGDKTYMQQAMVNKCDLAMASADILPLQYSMGLPYNSPYTQSFTEEIMAIHESGLLQIWKTRHWPKPGFCKGSLLKEPKAITLIDIQSAFYLIGIGIFVAGFILFVEYLKQKYYKWKEFHGKIKNKETIRHINTLPKLDEFIYNDK